MVEQTKIEDRHIKTEIKTDIVYLKQRSVDYTMVLSMDRWVGKVAVVTGASSGIGAAVAEDLVGQGLKVVGLARRKHRLDELAKKLTGKKGKLYALQADISKEEDILNAFKWIKDNLGPVHVLVNNAGILKMGSLIENKTELWEEVLNVNVLGLCIATREAVKDMKAGNVDGHIIHVNARVGHQIPNLPMNIYPASKFAVRALAETLRLELNSQKSKIKITDLSPGPVYTEILKSAPEEITNLRDQMVKDKHMLDAEDVADAVRYALSTPPHVQIQELILRTVNGNF